MPIPSAVSRIIGPLMPLSVRRRRECWRFFNTHEWRNLHWGVFDSLEMAETYALQHGQPAHYTLDQRKWLAERQTLAPHDYPVLHWMERAMQRSSPRLSRIADLGGSVGVSYFTFEPFLPLRTGVVWQICELPETVQLGHKIARERGETHLQFTSEVADLDGADILFTAGTIQFIPTPLHEMLARLTSPPAHLLINRLPLSQFDEYFTLQNSGTSVAPCRIANDGAFVKSLTDAGYALIDRWQCLQNNIHIPFHPERTLTHFHGLYLERH